MRDRECKTPTDGKARGSGGKGIGMNDLKSQRTPDFSIGQAIGTGKKINRANDKTLAYATMKEIYKYFGNIKWSWKNFIPIGHITMIAGAQGQGKSYFAAHIMSVLTGAQEKWPDGKINTSQPGKVVLIDTENMRGEYVVRLMKLGVRGGDVLFPLEMAGSKDMTYTVDLVTGLPQVEGLVTKLNCVGVIVDSLTGGHEFDENKSQMKKILKPLSDMAANLQVPVIVVHDLRKKNALEAPQVTLDKVRGSVVIPKFCRSVMGLYRPNETNQSPTRVDMIKTNFCRPPRPFGFIIGNNGLTFCEAPEIPKLAKPIDRAINFLARVLADGSMKYNKLIGMAEEEGITKNSLYNARDLIGISTIAGVWSLPTIDGQPYPVTRTENNKILDNPTH
jgi:hypothetical protein